MDDQITITKVGTFTVASGEVVKKELNTAMGESKILNRVVPAGKVAEVVITLQYSEKDA